MGKTTVEDRSSRDRQSTSNLFEETFRELADQWVKETGMSSSITRKVQHPAYRKIIAMGEKAIPLILRQLRDRPGHWFEALKSITRQTPVLPKERADPKKGPCGLAEMGEGKGVY